MTRLSSTSLAIPVLALTAFVAPVASANYMLLPGGGRGYYTYEPSSHRWGKPRMIHGLVTLARKWDDKYKGKKLGYGDISKKGGGYFPPHETHRYGTDSDSRPIGDHGNAIATSVGWSSYSTSWTRRYVALIKHVIHPRLIYHNNNHIPGVRYCPGHDNHLHTSI